MNTIDLGRVTIISDPEFQPPAPGGSGQGAPGLAFRTEPTTLAEAAAAAPFTILQPTSLPRPNMALAGVKQIVKHLPPAEPELHSVLLTYTDGADCWAIVTQTPAFDGSFIVTDEVSEGQIGSQPAALFSRTLTAWGQPGVQVALSLCFWEQDDLLLELQSRGLSNAELMVLAASLA